MLFLQAFIAEKIISSYNVLLRHLIFLRENQALSSFTVWSMMDF